jgi:formate dehydrogenase subunit gamma
MMKERKSKAGFLGACAVVLALAFASAPIAGNPALAQIEGRTVEQPSPLAGNVPGGHLGTSSDSEIWRAVRHGLQGNVSIGDKQAGVMIQSEGDNWRAWRNGPITVGGAWGLLGVIGLIALFFVVRGRIKIDAGPSDQTVERFDGLDRFAHWMSAVSFILLGLTGLNMLYGKHVLLPVLGPDAFAALTQAGKYVHDFIAFPFMAGLVLMFVLWARHNVINKYDLIWLAKGGGMLMKGVHPPSKRFNMGQKLLFWLVILGGLLLSLSGISLLFPFEFAMFAWTFEVLNNIGFGLPAEVTALQEMQLSQWVHAVVALITIVVIIGHIYIGSLGMEGAFDAMGTGHVDRNWALEHHNLWMAEVEGGPAPGTGGEAQPAE